MRIILASDHAGRKTREAIRKHLSAQGHQVEALGPESDEKVDYPDFAAPAAARVSSGEFDRGVFVCGTGMGMEIVANKIPGIRAVAPYDDYTAQMSRAHNDANVACFGERSIPAERAIHLLDVWLKTPFEGGRH